MDIRPILTAEDHKEALREIDRLWGARRGSSDARVLDVLVTLVDAYEARHFPIEAADPVEVIRTHMNLTGRTQNDLPPLFESASRASEVLSKKRALTMEMARRLHKQWGIPAEVLIEPYELAHA